jgi:predicted O-methyltransferase YrrM
VVGPTRPGRDGLSLLLDDRVRTVLERLEREDADERARGLPAARRSRQVAPATGRFLFSLVAPQTDCEVLELGGSRGYSTVWLAAGVRHLGGRVLSLEHDPAKAAAWRRNVDEAGLTEWAELVEGDALETLPAIDDVFDVVFLDAEKEDYERLFALAREKLEPGALVIADNVLSHEETLGAYSRARQSDRTLSSVTVPLDRGLELTVILR